MRLHQPFDLIRLMRRHAKDEAKYQYKTNPLERSPGDESKRSEAKLTAQHEKPRQVAAKQRVLYNPRFSSEYFAR